MLTNYTVLNYINVYNKLMFLKNIEKKSLIRYEDGCLLHDCSTM
jgi:hypothetical protein